MAKILLWISLFTITCMCWLSVMEIKLRHPAFGVRVGMDLCIALISLATVAVLLLRLEAHTRAWLLAGGFVLIGVGGAAFFRNMRGAHFEGFVLIISVALVFQGLLMLTSLRKSKHRDPGSSQLAGSKGAAVIGDSQRRAEVKGGSTPNQVGSSSWL